LIIQGRIAHFFIGEPLTRRTGTCDDEVGVFELVTCRNKTVGEVTTTYGRAQTRAAKHRQTLISISWGFSLQHARPHPSYLPRWETYNDGGSQQTEGEAHEIVGLREAAVFFHAKQSMSKLPFMRSALEQIDRIVPGRWLPIPDAQLWEHEVPTMELYKKLRDAKKGGVVPRDLWPVVNVMLVDWDGTIVRRAGIGRVIKAAWEEIRAPPSQFALG
jgi:hypothetical protein